MAKLRMGILDGFQGRVGPVVGYRLGSKWIMRRLPQQVCNPRTERQVAHRMMFRDIVRLASALLPALKVGYRAQAGLWEMTEGNAFVKMNWLRDRMPGFNELRISVGAVPMVGFTRVSMEGGRLEAQWEKNQQLAGAKADDRVHFYAYSERERRCLEWEKNQQLAGAKADDRVHFYAYSERERRCLELGTAEHRDRRAEWLLPEGYTHVWAVMEDRMGRTSNSLYLEPLEPGEEVAGDEQPAVAVNRQSEPLADPACADACGSRFR